MSLRSAGNRPLGATGVSFLFGPADRELLEIQYSFSKGSIPDEKLGRGRRYSNPGLLKAWPRGPGPRFYGDPGILMPVCPGILVSMVW